MSKRNGKCAWVVRTWLGIRLSGSVMWEVVVDLAESLLIVPGSHKTDIEDITWSVTTASYDG